VAIIVAEFGGDKGMSLLEVMVAMFMVALISSNLMGGFIISNKMIKLTEQETRASSYAYAILEDLRARPEDNKWEKLEYYCVLRIDLGYNIIKQRC
jgi:prepilin-type N-terminal cleavage/methylation domain-containing protein